MVVLISILMVLLVTGVILYPFLRRGRTRLEMDEEGSPEAELGYRWEGVIAGLKDAEMERAIGTLPEKEYQWVRQQYMAEAVALLRAAEVEQQEEEAFLGSIEEELQQVRRRVLGGQEADSQDGTSPQGEASDG